MRKRLSIQECSRCWPWWWPWEWRRRCSLFASAHPRRPREGGREEGVPRRRQARPALQEDSPIPDYAFPGIENERVATGAGRASSAPSACSRSASASRSLLRTAGPATRGPARPRRPTGDRASTVRCSLRHSLAADRPGGRHRASRVHRLDPRAKIVGLLGVTAGRGQRRRWSCWPVFAACVAGARDGVPAPARVPLAEIWRRARFILPLIVLLAAVFIPFVRDGGEASTRSARSRCTRQGLAVFGGGGRSRRRSARSCGRAARRHDDRSPRCCAGSRRCGSPRLLVLIAVVHVPLPVRDRVRQVSRMKAALLSRGYRPRHALAGGRRRARGRPRCSCAPTAAASACTWRCWRAATRAAMPYPRAARRSAARDARLRGAVLALLIVPLRIAARGGGVSCAIACAGASLTPTRTDSRALRRDRPARRRTASAWRCSGPTAPARRR